MKLLRLRFQSIFSFLLSAGSSSKDPVPRSWLVVGLPPPSGMKAGTAVLDNAVGHNAINADKSAFRVAAFASVVDVATPSPFGAVATLGFADDGPVTRCS